jgi:hypothetical protein
LHRSATIRARTPPGRTINDGWKTVHQHMGEFQMRRARLQTIVGLVGFFALASPVSADWFRSSKTPLQKYLAANKYTTFTVPRTDWSVGTVVSFPRGVEQIEQFNKDCLKLVFEGDVPKEAADVEFANASLTASSYTLDRNAKIELDLPKVISPEIDVKASFSDDRVSKIKVELQRPREWSSSTGRVTQRAKKLAIEKDGCAPDLFAKNNVVLFRVLSVDSMKYEFQTKTGTTIKLDAALLNKMGVTGEFANKLDGMTSLQITTPTLIGYRVYKLAAKAGFADSNVTAKELSPAEVERLRGNQEK